MSAISSLSVFFPAYNEEANIESMIAASLEVLPRFTDDFEIITVDDGSTDRTAEIVLTCGHHDPRVRLVKHETNKGYGAAVRTGFASSTKDYIFFTDGDAQFDIREIGRLIDRVEDSKIVIGYRMKRRDPWNRRLNAFLYNRLIRVLFGLRVRDLNCAFKIFHNSIINHISIDSDGALVNAEILIKAHRLYPDIVEVGVTHLPRRIGVQTGAQPKVIGRMFVELFRQMKKLRAATQR